MEEIETSESELNNRAKDIRARILAEYKLMVDKISEDHFRPIKDAIEAETSKKVNVEGVIEVFKKDLFNKIKRQFDTNWEAVELDQSLKCLEFSKNLATDKSKKWRPTHAKPEEQANPSGIEMLEKRKRILEVQADYQNGKIEKLVPILEERRKHLKEQVAKRENVLALIVADCEKMKIVDEEIDSMMWREK